MKISKLFSNLTQYNRRGLSKEFVNDRAYRLDKSIDGEYMLGLAFGNAKTFASQRLAENASDARILLSKPQMPLLAQQAILVNMVRILPSDYCLDTREKGAASADIPMNTRQALEVARDFVISEYGRASLEHAVYIAHPGHMQRVEEMAKKLDFRGTPFVDTDVIWNTGQENYGAGATVSPTKWARYELKARIHHMLKGWA